MEILSDATFKGKVNVGNKVLFGKPGTEMILNDGNFTIYDGDLDLINTSAYISGDFYVTYPDNSNPVIQTGKYDDKQGIHFYGTEMIHGGLIIDGNIELNEDDSISSWSDLNYKLDFAPSSLSTTVNSHTTRINSACSTISSLCSRVNSLCTSVDNRFTVINHRINNLPTFGSITLDFDVPSDCTSFTVYSICAVEPDGTKRNVYHMFMTKGTTTRSPVNIDLEARCADNSWDFVATKSSGLAMCASDNYTFMFLYK